MALTVEQRITLLEAIWRLRDQRDYPSIAAALSTEDTETLGADSELGYLYAEAQYQTGKWDESFALVRQLERSIAHRGNDRLFRRWLNLKAALLLVRGELSEAQVLFERVFDAANAAGDEPYTADACNALGIVASIQCRWDAALGSYRQAIAAYHRLGHIYGLGGSYHNLGMAHRQLGRFLEADSNFERALSYLMAAGNVGFIATCEAERALVRSLLGDSEVGRLLAVRALRRFEEIGHAGGMANALKVLGVVTTHVGRNAEAREHFEKALQFATHSGDRLTEAEILEELAVLDAKDGNREAASERGGAASDIYRALGAFQRAQKAQERIGTFE